MNDSTGDAAGRATPASGSAAESDYRMREMEARLERRLVAVEARGARSRWAAGVASAALLAALGALAVVLWTGVSDDGTRTLQSLSTQELLLAEPGHHARLDGGKSGF